ncbi:zinc finger protein SNAI3 [Protobothrops mucrosquamatus]|uniref:zinc finger protein SNAI3 n=1 Tax=Protobothrops mucrosquamatus TaxID=103944 RepID=UPI0010FAEB3E|nr:zinc finger protein SNAI3 [Protobothrops mucrosquamatus]
MPRSFLVKKPSGSRLPDYGQLETRRQGMRFSREAKGQLALNPQSGERAGGSRGSATPLRDNPNNLNLPPAFSLLPWRTCPGLGHLAEAEGHQLPAEPGVRTDPLERFTCLDCHKPYSTFSSLARHQQQHCKLQAAATTRFFSCKYCNKGYTSLGALKMHIRTHTLPCVCKICSKAFSRPWLLQGHIRTHTGEKPYSCSHCSRAFADRSNLRAHLQTHSEIKRYQCCACSKTFSRMSLLLRHKEAASCATAS